MGRLRIMGTEGDRQVEWTLEDPESLRRAEREVAQWLQCPGRLAFGFTRSQLEAAERLDAFDPHASEIILVPQMRGG